MVNNNGYECYRFISVIDFGVVCDGKIDDI